MRLEKVELLGFRGLEKEGFQLKDLTTIFGKMGTGKTSKLLAILYGLTGSIPPYLNLDDLININSEFLWVKLTGSHDGQPYTIERRKRRGQAASVKATLSQIALSEKIFIEGREIAELFVGAPAEKALKIDALLGLSNYDQAAAEISAAPIERKIEELESLRSRAKQAADVSERLSKVEGELAQVEQRLQQVNQQLERDAQLFSWAEEVQRKVLQNTKLLAEIQSRRDLIESYKQQLSLIPPFPSILEEELRELEARYQAMQRRVAFLGAAMQTLEGKGAEGMDRCPLCGASLSPLSLERLKHYGSEYKDLTSRSSELGTLLNERRRKVERLKEDQERARLLQGQIKSLEEALASLYVEAVKDGDVERANEVLKDRSSLVQEKRELELKRSSLEDQAKVYKSFQIEVGKISAGEIESKVLKLGTLRDRIKRIRLALTEAVNEVRNEHLGHLRAAFKEAFRRVYPYGRFSEVDFDTVSVRGREVLTVKAKADGGWLQPHQMSTGENVAISFALLFAINQLERSPVLLLDEPEEGLDEEGISGLADVLNKLKENTQLVVATRSQQLAQLLQL